MTKTMLGDRDPSPFPAAEHGVVTLGGGAVPSGRRATAADERRLVGALRASLARVPVPLDWQPMVRLFDLAPAGSEALLRWRLPDGTSVPPARLIPLVERYGLHEHLDTAVLRSACRHAASRPEPLRIAVNVSACWFQMAETSLATVLEDMLGESGLDPGLLTIEVTEHAVIADPVRAGVVFRALTSLGVRIALDDFGVGQSSLSRLADHAFDLVKLDQSFARRIGTSRRADALILGVARLVTDLGLAICFEGVETEAQSTFLRQHASGLMQGFHVDALLTRSARAG